MYLIEAHANAIVEYFDQLSDEDRKELLKKIGPKKLPD